MMHGKRFQNIQCPVYCGTFFLSPHGAPRKPCLFSHACTVTEESFLSSVRAFESSSLRNSGNQWAYCIPLKATLANDFVRRERISTGRTGTLACPHSLVLGAPSTKDRQECLSYSEARAPGSSRGISGTALAHTRRANPPSATKLARKVPGKSAR